MDRNSADEENKTVEHVSLNRKKTWQKPELMVLEIQKTQGGALGVSESIDGDGLFS